jgi:hypothetical protein
MTGKRDGKRDTGESGDATRAGPGTREAAERAASIAQTWTERAVLGIVRDTGGPIITRPRWPGGAPVLDTEALTGLRTAADVEQRARQLARGYIRTAREDGASWPEIGAALDLAANDEHDSAAEAAFGYAAPADSYYARIYGPTCNWRCPACYGLIRDLGPHQGSPARSEEKHGPGCPRLAADLAAYHAARGEQ